jgi:hypothetical protein
MRFGATLRPAPYRLKPQCFLALNPNELLFGISGIEPPQPSLLAML